MFVKEPRRITPADFITSARPVPEIQCALNSLEALRIMRALVSAASSFDFRIARSTPSQQCLAPAILDVRRHLLLQIWAKRPSNRVRSSVSRGTEDFAAPLHDRRRQKRLGPDSFLA